MNIRAFSIYFVLFFILFFLHILFAAKEWHILFQIVAFIITIMILFSGLIIVLIAKTDSNYEQIFGQGFLLSIPLSIGLGWAYGGMSYSVTMAIFPAISIVIHLIIWHSKVLHTYGLK